MTYAVKVGGKRLVVAEETDLSFTVVETALKTVTSASGLSYKAVNIKTDELKSLVSKENVMSLYLAGTPAKTSWPVIQKALVLYYKTEFAGNDFLMGFSFRILAVVHFQPK